MGLYCYIAGPISKGDQFHNVVKGIRTAERVRARGHIPIVPHLSFIWHMLCDDEKTINYEQWMEYDFALIRRCDALLRIPGDSLGADREVKLATELGMPVFFGIDEFMESPYWTMKFMPAKSGHEFWPNSGRLY